MFSFREIWVSYVFITTTGKQGYYSSGTLFKFVIKKSRIKNDPSRFHQKSPMSLKAAVHDIRFIKRNLDIMKTHKSVMNISNIENKILPSEN